MQGPVERRGFRDANSSADGHQLLGDVRRHLRLHHAGERDGNE